MQIENPGKPSLAIVTIATNQYIHYWKSMALTMDRYATNKNEVTFHIFTDRPDLAAALGDQLRNSKLQIKEVPSWKWPEVALKRYEVIYHGITSIKSNYVMYIDADMLVHSEIPNIGELLANQRIALTAHPGFWRPKVESSVFYYLKRPLNAIRDFRMWIRMGALGAWETNSRSSAFVPRNARNKYICGGFWLGEKQALFELVEELMKQTSRDLNNSIEAIWLDESHLNKWASKNLGNFVLLNPEYCFDPTYPQLRELNVKIEAVNKEKNPIVSTDV